MRVPSYEEATSPAFRQEDRFEAADRMLKERLGELCAQGTIHGAFLYGSASFGDTNAGSDRDVIVAYNGNVYETEPATLDALHGVATAVYAATSVPLEVTCATLDEFQEGEHQLTDPMLEWLRQQPEQFPHDGIGEPFIGDIAYRRRPVRTDFTELEGWLARTHHVLQKEYLQGNYFRPSDLLGQIYSLPHVATRKTINALEINGFGAGPLESLTKEGIANSLYSTYDRKQAISCQLYDEVTRHARMFYDELLPEADRLTEDEYGQIIIAEIDHNLPKAIHLLTRLQMVHRCTRAHLRLRIGPFEDDGLVLLTEGDEGENGTPFLPAYLRQYMRACDLNGQPLQ